MYRVTLIETFQATHSLDTLRPEPHAHEWVVHVHLQAETLQPPGITVNYFELQPLVKSYLPHGVYLNEHFSFAPTAENLAKHFYDALKPKLPLLSAVSVGEFPEFMCQYSPDG